jgi:hypothetical protein
MSLRKPAASRMHVASLRERGLKHRRSSECEAHCTIRSLAGAWIEMSIGFGDTCRLIASWEARIEMAPDHGLAEWLHIRSAWSVD